MGSKCQSKEGAPLVSYRCVIRSSGGISGLHLTYDRVLVMRKTSILHAQCGPHESPDLLSRIHEALAVLLCHMRPAFSSENHAAIFYGLMTPAGAAVVCWTVHLSNQKPSQQLNRQTVHMNYFLLSLINSSDVYSLALSSNRLKVGCK